MYSVFSVGFMIPATILAIAGDGQRAIAFALLAIVFALYEGLGELYRLRMQLGARPTAPAHDGDPRRVEAP